MAESNAAVPVAIIAVDASKKAEYAVNCKQAQFKCNFSH